MTPEIAQSMWETGLGRSKFSYKLGIIEENKEGTRIILLKNRIVARHQNVEAPVVGIIE